MITTAAGLAIAIPVLICYHWISAKIDRLVSDIDYMTVDFLEQIADGDLNGVVEATPNVAEAGPEAAASGVRVATT